MKDVLGYSWLYWKPAEEKCLSSGLFITAGSIIERRFTEIVQNSFFWESSTRKSSQRFFGSEAYVGGFFSVDSCRHLPFRYPVETNRVFGDSYTRADRRLTLTSKGEEYKH
mmetsp:Transcript_21195/g.25519  ORF Transcript_21195/g.25519 Transcript_21195/m.25519 type:complete len:111 (+) Transcript_21195:2908-3240(+)